MWSLCIWCSSEVVYWSRFYYKKGQHLRTASLFGQTCSRGVVRVKMVPCCPLSSRWTTLLQEAELLIK